jgi:hypothetical protein
MTSQENKLMNYHLELTLNLFIDPDDIAHMVI